MKIRIVGRIADQAQLPIESTAYRRMCGNQISFDFRFIVYKYYMSVFIDEFDEADGRGCATFLILLEIISCAQAYLLCEILDGSWGGSLPASHTVHDGPPFPAQFTSLLCLKPNHPLRNPQNWITYLFNYDGDLRQPSSQNAAPIPTRSRDTAMGSPT